jgi:hypothetical protein
MGWARASSVFETHVTALTHRRTAGPADENLTEDLLHLVPVVGRCQCCSKGVS